MIGQCRIVISSRFHGLVSALSQSVPVLAMGWSHKYKELLTDYDCEEFLIPVDGIAISKALENIDKNYPKIKRRIEVRAKEIKAQVSQMWATVASIVEKKKS